MHLNVHRAQERTWELEVCKEACTEAGSMQGSMHGSIQEANTERAWRWQHAREHAPEHVCTAAHVPGSVWGACTGNTSSQESHKLKKNHVKLVENVQKIVLQQNFTPQKNQ